MVQLGEPSPSVCMAFPALSAVHEGYRVFAVINASGTDSKMAEEITLVRIVQTGVVPMDTAAVACPEAVIPLRKEFSSAASFLRRSARNFS